MEKLNLPEGGRYNPELAQQYKEQAMEELSAKGVTFPCVGDQVGFGLGIGLIAGVHVVVDLAGLLGRRTISDFRCMDRRGRE